MNTKRIFALFFIFGCSAAAWFLLGSALTIRTSQRDGVQQSQVGDLWGPPLEQAHPEIFYMAATGRKPRVEFQPSKSEVTVKLDSEEKRRGLLKYRTYVVDFDAVYTVQNPSPIQQMVYIRFKLPAEGTSFYNFNFKVGSGGSAARDPEKQTITESVLLGPSESVPVRISYRAHGMNQWIYTFGGKSRIHNFALKMTTNFPDIDFPVGTSSAPVRKPSENGWELEWSYPDVISAVPLGMAMPKVLNPGPVAARISFFAPISLLFFFAVLILVCMVWQIHLHPMNYFFLAAGFFAFQLLFSYLVDLVQIHVSFVIAALVSLVLVGGYVHLATHGKLTRVAVAAQLAYMVLFSYSFFFDGLTGLTITIGAIITLALLMALTARTDWASRFAKPTPPPMPAQVP